MTAETPTPLKIPLTEWLTERMQNCEYHARKRAGVDRKGWLEDAAYFKATIESLTDLAECRARAIGWVACVDRLPDDDKPVAVTGPTIEGNAAIANFMGDMWLVQSGTPDMGPIDITHWCDCIPALPVLK